MAEQRQLADFLAHAFEVHEMEQFASLLGDDELLTAVQ